MRQERSRSLVAELEPWLREKLGLISQKTKLAEAIRHTLSPWAGLTRFLDAARARPRPSTSGSPRRRSR
jgi:transposase